MTSGDPVYKYNRGRKNNRNNNNNTNKNNIKDEEK